MLTQIHIRDLATIAELHLALTSGCTMITGETGAGKSIFIEAIELALGERASANLVRAGKDKSEISLVFDITDFPKVINCLKQLDLYHDTRECIIRRVITADGRSRCYVNETPATLSLVKDLADLLFHFHGQFEQQVLLRAESQREMLDRFADLLPLALEVKTLAEQWKALDTEIYSLKEKSLAQAEASNYLLFQLEELQALNLKPGEWELLEAEHHKLTHNEELLRNIQLAIVKMDDDSNLNLLSLLNELSKTFEAISPMETKALEWLTVINSTIIQIADLSSDLKNYLDSTELDPEKIKKIEERISEIFDISRKHKVTPQNLLDYQDKLQKELDALRHSDEALQAKSEEQKKVAANYTAKALKLSGYRQEAALKLSREITKTICSLSLPHGEFKVMFEKEETPFAQHGHEKVIFMIKTNPDQALTPLAKVISGGELSRLSLAVHLALACRTNIPTLVFDEVDTGLSGATAEKIGKLLRKLGESYQVFCVTHQAQVAACGHQHFLVEKNFIEKNTHTHIKLLDHKHKTREIARMLGGENITEKTLAHAKEVLENI